jgi:hypothetical protein
LARLALPGGPLDTVADRPLLYSNPLLFDLVLALINQVNALSGELLLYVSGDNQSGPKQKLLTQPLIVALQDGSGNPIDGGTVQFAVTAGGGSVTATAAPGNGKYQTQWKLGRSGPQTVVAKAAGTNLTVTFKAQVL